MDLAMVFFWGALNLDLSLWTVFAAHTVIAIPYVLRVTLAVLVGMPPALLKAARSAGANPWRAFLHITLPYITPGLIAGISFAFVISFTNIPVSLFSGGDLQLHGQQFRARGRDRLRHPGDCDRAHSRSDATPRRWSADLR